MGPGDVFGFTFYNAPTMNAVPDKLRLCPLSDVLGAGLRGGDLSRAVDTAAKRLVVDAVGRHDLR